MKTIMLNFKEFYLKQLNNNKNLTVCITILLFILLVIVVPKPLSEKKRAIKESVYKQCLKISSEKKCKCYANAYIKQISDESSAYRLFVEVNIPSNDGMKQIYHDIFLAELDCINVK